MIERQFAYYENSEEEIFTLSQLESQFNGYTVEERQHEHFIDWLQENLKMQILIER
jgi:hypothetical protein